MRRSSTSPGSAPQAGLPQLDRFGGYIVAGLNAPWTNLPNLGVQGPRERGNPNWNAAADMSWLRGKHNFKVGFQMLQISRLQTNQFGQINYSAEATRDPQNTATTGDPIASALLGLPSRIQGFVPTDGYIDFHTSTHVGLHPGPVVDAAEPDVHLRPALRLRDARASATTDSRAVPT